MSAEQAELTRREQVFGESIEVGGVGTKLTESLQRFRVRHPGIDLAHIESFVP